MRSLIIRWATLVVPAAAVALSSCASSPELRGSPVEQGKQVELGVSRIPRMVDVDHPDKDTPWPVTIITREELQSTGGINLDEAIRRTHAGPFFRP